MNKNQNSLSVPLQTASSVDLRKVAAVLPDEILAEGLQLRRADVVIDYSANWPDNWSDKFSDFSNKAK